MKRGEVSQALYRKYRSRGFDEVVGQQHVTELLANSVKNGQISHAYLFTGPRGTGKTSVARILAHMVNDLPYADDTSHLDIIEIDAASNRRIDDIRDLREKVFITPTSARYKVYIIDEVHMLTGESFNALLKTLEEPPEHAIFILATTELHKVPATIVSRTQRFHFRPGSVKDVSKHLRMIADKEKIAIDDEALRLIAEHSEGGFRDSVSLLDQVSSLDHAMITAEIIEHLLGLAPRERVVRIVDMIAAGEVATAISELQELLNDGLSPVVIISQLMPELSRQAGSHPQLYELLTELIEVPRSYSPQLKLLAIIGRQARDTALQEKPDSIIHTSSKPIQTVGHPAPQPSPKIVKTTPTDTTPKSPPKPADPEATDISTTNQHATDSNTTAINWQSVLDTLHSRAPALHSIVKRAEVDITPRAISLKFAFALHRKKLQDEKNRNELAGIVTSLFGSCPPIIVNDAASHLDATAATVADIMGGGEAVKPPREGKE